MPDVKNILAQLPNDLQQEVVDFAEFLLARKNNVRPGARVRPIERKAEKAAQPITEDAIERACGMLKSPTSATKELLRMRKEDRKRENAKAQNKLRP